MEHKEKKIKLILHLIVIIFMILALIVGISLSSVRVSNDLKLGSQYRGSFQAMVGVYHVNSKNSNDSNNTLPSGNADKGADVLQNKLSPFSDGSVNVTINGKSRLSVTAPRDSYENNEQLFKDAIESTGGLFILDDQNKDIMLNKELLARANIKLDSIENKKATSELLGQVSQVSERSGATNKPFLKFALNNDNFFNILNGKNNEQAPVIRLVVDIDTVLKTLRNYFEYSSPQEQDVFLENYIKGIIQPLQKLLSENKNNDQSQILKDFFEIDYWESTRGNDGPWVRKHLSLVDPNQIGKTDNLERLKTILYADNKAERKFTFTNPINKYTYDSNSLGEEFGTGGRYSNTLKINNNTTDSKLKVDQAFNILTSSLLPLLFNESTNIDHNNNPANIKDFFKPELFNDSFIFHGQVGQGSLPLPYASSIMNQQLFVGTKNYTQARKAAAQISQTADGYSFAVLSLTRTQAIISREMLIASLTILILLLVIAALFILFFYRLLGFFTIIIAAIIGSMTLLMATIFGISVGPEILIIAFILIAVTFDISIVLFEALKTNIYQEKRPLGISFNIANRETLGLVTDVLIATVLPNIVLFWIGVGFLKNFATILTLGILITFVFGVVIFRLLIFIVMKSPVFKKSPELLPLDTSLGYEGSFWKSNLIRHYSNSLEKMSKKNQLTTKELLKVKKWEEKIQELTLKNKKIIQQKQEKQLKKQTRIFDHYQEKRQKIVLKKDNLKLDDQNGLKERLLINKIGYYDALLTEKKADNAVKAVRLQKLQKSTSFVSTIVVLATVVLVILSLVISLVFGFNYSKNYGKGTQFYIYGSYISRTFGVLDSAEQIEGISKAPNSKKIQEDLRNIAKNAKTEILAKNNIEKEEDATKKIRNQWESKGVVEAYRYMITNDFMKYLSSDVRNVSFINANYQNGDDYSMMNPITGTFEEQPWVSITVTNNLISKNNLIKNAFQIFANAGSGIPNRPIAPNNEGGVLGLELIPHTSSAQMKQIAVTFGIVLLALLVYMIIRFKWTYYVALALSLLIIISGTISIVIILRVPFTIEALSGILGVLCFALLTSLLFLGKGKSLIVSRNEESLNRYFNNEIELESKKKNLKRKLKKELRKEFWILKQEFKKLDKTDTQYKKNKKELRETQKKIYKELKHQKYSVLKEEFKQINSQIKLESKKNNFLKEIYVDVLKFSILKISLLGLFSLIFSITLTVTLTSISIMGLILTVGVIMTCVVGITILLPIWIKLENHRIRLKYGYKRFVKKLKVKNEEQVIEGLND